MRISDWSSDVCSSDLRRPQDRAQGVDQLLAAVVGDGDGQHQGIMTLRRLLGGLDRRAQGGWQEVEAAGGADAHLALVHDRKSVVSGKRVSVRVDLGGRLIIKKQKTNTNNILS